MKTHLMMLAVLAGVSTPAVAASFSAEPKPVFGILAVHGDAPRYAPGHAPAGLRTWNGTITYNQTRYKFTMVGTNPKTSNATTTIAVYLIPVKMVYGKSNGKKTFDPLVDQQNGVSIVQNLLNSPLFNALDWNWGGTDFGNTQYEDAFQRGSFWSEVGGKNSDYHVVFVPSVLAEVTLKVSAKLGSVIANPFGSGQVGTMDINTFDARAQSALKSFSHIKPTVLPVFVTDNIYMTQDGSCCIGGYSSVEPGGQTYIEATYETAPGSFSEDISGFSHEFGEWLDNPLLTSNSPCGVLDVAGPTGEFPNYGTFPVTYGGVTWHPQALAWLEYFGAKENFSGNNWLDNQHLLTSVCQNGS